MTSHDTTAGVRASDTERERTVEELRRHYETGHIDYTEFNRRMESAYQATYAHELTTLVADLPGAARAWPGTQPVLSSGKPQKGKPGTVRVLAIVALVLAALVGAGWLAGLVTSHPVITTLAVVAVVIMLVKKPFRRRG